MLSKLVVLGFMCITMLAMVSHLNLDIEQSSQLIQHAMYIGRIQ